MACEFLKDSGRQGMIQVIEGQMRENKQKGEMREKGEWMQEGEIDRERERERKKGREIWSESHRGRTMRRG